MTRQSFFITACLSAALAFGADDNKKDSKKKETEPPPPYCKHVTLKAGQNNAKELADSLNTISTSITARAVGTGNVLVCGDNADKAVDNLATAAGAMGRIIPPSGLAQRETPLLRLFHLRDAKAVQEALKVPFPKLTAVAIGTDALLLGDPEGTDAATVRLAKRWVSAIDVPRPEVTLNIWSVKVSSKDPTTVTNLATAVREIVTAHNRALQEALGRGFSYLQQAIQKDKDTFFPPVLHSYLTKRYVVPGTPGMPRTDAIEGRCDDGQYCLGYYGLYNVQPSLQSMLVTALSAKGREEASRMVDRLEGRPKQTSCVTQTRRNDFAQQKTREDYANSSTAGKAAVKANITTTATATKADVTKRTLLYQLYKETWEDLSLRRGKLHPDAESSCEEIGEHVYKARRQALEEQRKKGQQVMDDWSPYQLDISPVFPCLREALSDATEPAELARIRVALAHFLFQNKFRQHYPNEFDFGTHASQRMDAILSPLLSSFNRDMLSYLRHVREEVKRSGAHSNPEIASNGIVTLSTLSHRPSSTGTKTQSAFDVTAPIPLAELFKQAATDKGPAVLTNNLTPGAAAIVNAGLANAGPTVATLGREMILNVTAFSLPTASSAELAVNLTSQEVGDPTVRRANGSSTSDLKSRVAKHNLDTPVRVDSLRLFELSDFGSETERGGDSIPILPPYVEVPGIGGLLRWPVKPSKVYHRSFAIVSATVLPTAADMASSVRPLSDAIVDPVRTTLTATAAAEDTVEYAVSVHPEKETPVFIAGREISAPPTPAAPIRLEWGALGSGPYTVHQRSKDGSWKCIAKGFNGTVFMHANGTAEEKDCQSLPAAYTTGSATLKIVPAKAVEEKTYIIVAHRQDTSAVVAEQKVKTSGPSRLLPVQLTWTSAGPDVRYSVYRRGEKDGETKPHCVVADTLNVRLEDVGAPPVEHCVPIPPKDAFIPLALTRVTPATFLAPAVAPFHRERLECIEKEALSLEVKDCAKQKLSDFPSELP